MPATKEQMQVARSSLLDSFADVEEAVICLQTKLGHKTSAASLGQRLTLVRKIKASPQLAKTSVAQLHGHLDRLAALNILRGDIVHARMCVASIAGETRACFINSRECQQEFPSARLLTHEQFVKLNSELRALAGALKQLVD